MTDVYNYIVETGVIMPDTQDIQTDVQNEYLAVFPSLNVTTAATPQGLLISTEVAARQAVADNNANLANQINPNVAGGVFLDAIMALTGSFRTPGTPSSALCTITGVVGTSIPAGAQISDANGNLYQLVNVTVIPSGGTITGVLFTSVLLGAVPGVANTLTTIVSNILGWETVTNPAAAMLGAATQSDASARAFRANTLALQASGLAQAMTSAVYAVIGGGGGTLSFLENATSSPATPGGFTMVANSIYMCVNPGGATLTSIAQAMTNTKGGGCAYNQGFGVPQGVPITNSYSAQTITVLFDTPNFVTIGIIVHVTNFNNVQDVPSAVQNAILTYAGGGIPNEPGFAVGANVSPFQIAGAINILVPGLFVSEVQVAVNSFTQIGKLNASSMAVNDMTYTSDITTGLIVTDPLGYLPSGTTVASITDSNDIALNNNSTTTATEILTFSPASPSFQTTEITIKVFQQAVTNANIITVISS
jgi:hypothetical protein